MLNALFLQEIFGSKLILRDTSLYIIENMMQKLSDSTKITEISNKKHTASNGDMDGKKQNPYDSLEDNSIVIITISGIMFKYGYWDYGCDDFADMIRLAGQSDRVTGIVLVINTPGGTTNSIIQLEDALRNRTKPCIALVDGQCCSGGIYIASFCDEIYAMNRMCEIGSIGTYAQIYDESERLKNYGYKIIQIYPPESKYKNLSHREALEGKPERLIKEELTPFAIHFQNIIKENIPGIDLSEEGILEGKVFYSYDAVANRLIDGIMNLEQVVSRVRELSQINQNIYLLFK
ncbi:Protease 4 [termite gut metagenome]|uniref:Protease 4 n=1 Tax=termite gut metagenome TaxID=433724 RepID=A0A5J4STA3_9ZZZZ